MLIDIQHPLDQSNRVNLDWRALLFLLLNDTSNCYHKGAKCPSPAYKSMHATLPNFNVRTELCRISHCAVLLMMFGAFFKIATVCIISRLRGERCKPSHCSLGWFTRMLRGKRKCTQATWLQSAACCGTEMDGRHWNALHKGDWLRHNGLLVICRAVLVCSMQTIITIGGTHTGIQKHICYRMKHLLCFSAVTKTTQTNRP